MSKYIDPKDVDVNDPRLNAVAWLLRESVGKNLSFMETAATVVAWHHNETVRQAEEIERLKGVGAGCAKSWEEIFGALTWTKST